MARALRLESENDSYHILSRGNFRLPVCRDPKAEPNTSDQESVFSSPLALQI